MPQSQYVAPPSLMVSPSTARTLAAAAGIADIAAAASGPSYNFITGQYTPESIAPFAV